jgi:pyruvate dehydrogenase E1 component alpha subunit
MEYTSIYDVTAVEHPAADRASAYGLEPILIDGNDVELVYRTAVRALDYARRGGGPSLIEAETYRHGGHSRADPGKYRPDEEVKEWLGKDPIPRYRSRLLEHGIEESQLAAVEAEARAMIDRATEEARNAPPPDLGIAEIDVWADGGAAWRN